MPGDTTQSSTMPLPRNTGNPMLRLVSVRDMDVQDKIAEALERSLPYLPVEAKAAVQSMLEPSSLAIIAGTLAIWGASHFFGVGEIVDVVLLVVGGIFLGPAAWQAANALMDFATTAIRAQTEPDLNRAGKYFADAISIIGINVVMALLFRTTVKAVKARGVSPARQMGLPAIDGPPVDGTPKVWAKPTITADPTLPPGQGSTSAYGDITVSSAGSATDQALVLFHEKVHSFLSPKLSPLRAFRARVGTSAYQRSALLQYLEEALAETYTQLRVNGISALPTGIKFPVANGYVTISQLQTEGAAFGTIVLGTRQFTLQFVPGSNDFARP